MSYSDNKRSTVRQPVLRSAKIHLVNSVVDCLVLDTSDEGVRIGIDGMAAFPETMTIEFRSGAKWHAERRWQRGAEAGLALTEFAGLGFEAAVQAGMVQDRLRNSGLAAAIEQLELERYFEVPAIRAAAETLRAAEQHLATVLRAAIAGR